MNTEDHEMVLTMMKVLVKHEARLQEYEEALRELIPMVVDRVRKNP